MRFKYARIVSGVDVAQPLDLQRAARQRRRSRGEGCAGAEDVASVHRLVNAIIVGGVGVGFGGAF
jgi:hypothetical protein